MYQNSVPNAKATTDGTAILAVAHFVGVEELRDVNAMTGRQEQAHEAIS
jgi:hypothetical protein